MTALTHVYVVIDCTLPHNCKQWLKWKIRGEGTVYQLWAKMGPQQVVVDSLYEI